MQQLREVPESIPRRGNKLSRALAICILSLWGWRVVGELPNTRKLIIIAAPHTSNWDFVFGLALIVALGIRAHWLAKHTLFRRPMGWFMTWLGGIPVRRDASHGVVDGTAEIFETNEQFVLGVTPEGTRKKVKQWKTGFYFIALKANVPIVSAFMDYSRKELGFGPILVPTGDVKSDMETIQSFYKSIWGKRPELF